MIKAAKENDLRSIRNNYVSLSFYELCYRNAMLKLRPNASENEIKGALDVICSLGHSHYVENICSFSQKHENKLKYEELGKKYIEKDIEKDIQNGLRETLGDDYSNVLLIENGEPISCAIIVKNEGEWKLFQLLEVPEELNEMLKNI